MSLPAIGLLLDNHGPAAAALRAAQAAEAAGVTRVWLAEDLYHRGALPLAGAVLATTQRIGVGVGVVAPQLRPPAALAMDLRTMNDLGPGRFTLGLGAGVGERTKHIGLPARPPLTIVRQAIEQVRTLLAGGTLATGGLLHQAEGLTLSGAAGDGPAVPVYAAAVGPKALAQAGRVADGVVLSMMCSVEHIRVATGLVQEAAGAAGREPVAVVAYVPVCLLADKAAAKESMRRCVAGYMAAWAGLDFLSTLFTEWSPLTREDLTAAGELLAAADWAGLQRLLPDDLIDQFAVAGDLPECRRLLAVLAQAGVTEVALSCEDGRLESAFTLA
ncbi:MAG: LLM class flavin-dependent oxidoreductase [Bifidobacteriaceae bacterium]|nr:LLM class flavin-dependent oxidoreductase [Bifidobacteriaceae bacterium]